MKEEQLIAVHTLCTHYNIEISFVDALNEMGLISIEVVEEQPFVFHDQLSDIEKMIRMHTELNVNLEGIDVVFNLLQKERDLRNRMRALENRLRLYEDL